MHDSVAVGPAIQSTNLSHLQIWQDRVAAQPHAPALIARHQDAATYKWLGTPHEQFDCLRWSYSDLDRAARRLATALNRCAHIERRPIVTLVNTQVEWALFFWTAAYLHSPLVPINPKTASRRDEIAHMFKMTQPAVILAADATVASQLQDSLSDALDKVPLHLLAEGELSDWSSLSSVLPEDVTPPDTPDVVGADDTILILFTSGTTSLPKPCHLSSFMCVNAALGNVEARGLVPSHRLVQHLPNFHSYGVGWSLAFWLAGGTVVLPSYNYEAQASLECFERFHATHMSLVPTTAQAMMAHPYFTHADLSSLVCVDVSGAGVLPSVLDACISMMKRPAYSSYGMTESPNTLIWPDGSKAVVRHGEVYSGKPVRGTRVKVCEPESRSPVPRGTVGELHCGGPQVIHGYADPNVSSDNFYVDEEGIRWTVTGDQAVMDDDGAVRISGRYKDMIIRGGENISPASIEDYLQRQPGVAEAQVVGLADEMAGEVPIAIVTTNAAVDFAELKRGTSDDLGPAFAPKLILNLSDLGLQDFPKTASGKVRKVDLRESVKQHVRALEEAPTDAASTVDSLIQIWERISGTSGLQPASGIQTFSDSLMMMQLSSVVKKQLGKDVTVEDFKRCDTIQDQSDLIDSKPSANARVARPQRIGPPTITEMPYLHGDESRFEATRSLVTTTLEKHGLRWEDVEDVFPLPDWDAIFCHPSRPSAWNLRFSWHAPVPVRRLEAAVMESLSHHPTLRSMAMKDGEDTLLVPVRNGERWLSTAFTSGHEVATREDLRTLLLDHPELDCASMPGPMVRIHIARCREDDTSGLIFVGSHSTNDASMTKLWLDDVAALLTGESTPVPHVLFRDYANAFYEHRNGPEADNGVEYWTKKLRGIGSVSEKELWPPQRAPEWFKGVDYGWRRWNGAAARPGERTIPMAEKREAQKGVRKLVPVESLARLKKDYNVPVFMLVKAAIALLNVKLTGGHEAIFGTINAARTWPFASDYSSVEKAEFGGGNPLDISGCTTEYVLDRIPVTAAQSVTSFMQFVTRDEELNSSFVHTPFFRIVDRLRDPLSADDTRTFAERERDADSILSLIRRQSFNWLPTAPNATANPKGLLMQEMLTRMDNGLTITGFLAEDKKSVCLSLSWDAEHLSIGEARRALDMLAQLVEFMGQETNWQCTVGQVLRL
ncbi:acetyl-CoA synthetase-like protein [Piedraia hortae CBS 480.64]|uniref:Acetyl-CoA synthetase-like protein n=1 Tax=Piedraia hortae CBS 480.64 TaxID=1314780 RepID=A0A6A7C6Z6_9PEZI|nr:acetyl-CoA synthetase-like protein [Piedraia hortae CBS 480.64]